MNFNVVRNVLCDYLEPWEFAQLMRVNKYYYNACKKYVQYNKDLPISSRNYKWAVWLIRKDKGKLDCNILINEAVVQKKWAFVEFLNFYYQTQSGHKPIIYAGLISLIRENRLSDIDYLRNKKYYLAEEIKLRAQFGRPMPKEPYSIGDYSIGDYYYGLCAKGDDSVLKYSLPEFTLSYYIECYVTCVLHKHYELAKKIKKVEMNWYDVLEVFLIFYNSELMTVDIENTNEYVLDSFKYICDDYNVPIVTTVEFLDDYLWYGNEIKSHLMKYYYNLLQDKTQYKQIGMLLGIYYKDLQLLRESCIGATEDQLAFGSRVAIEKKNDEILKLFFC